MMETATTPMIKASELRVGNWVMWENEENEYWPLPIELGEEIDNAYKYKPITLTSEILEMCGFSQLPHFTVQNLWNKNIGRDRVISIACVGTPNEIIFLNEEQPPEVKNIIVLRNYDYDGKTYLHQLQNLYFALTGTELEINL
jgi:hypothetical protein